MSQLVLSLSPLAVPGQEHLLQQVLGTLFDILISHYRMAKYHEESLAALQAHVTDTAASDQDCQLLKGRPCSNGGASNLQARASDAVSSPQASRATG